MQPVRKARATRAEAVAEAIETAIAVGVVDADREVVVAATVVMVGVEAAAVDGNSTQLPVISTQ